MMKLILGISAFLSICGAQFTVEIETASNVHSLLPQINAERMIFLKGVGLPKFANLTWDRRLAILANAENISKICNRHKGGYSDLAFYYDGGDENAKKLEHYTDKRREELLNGPGQKTRTEKLAILGKLLSETTRMTQLFNPTQKILGCADVACTGYISPEIANKAGMSGDMYEYKVLCFVGPYSKWHPVSVEIVLDDLESKKSWKGFREVEKEDDEDDSKSGVQNSTINAQNSTSDAQNGTQLRFSASALLLAFLMVLIININHFL